MKPRWEDVNARARGLATHLLTRGQLDSLAQAPDAAALADGLRRAGFAVAEEGVAASPAALELAVRRTAAAQLRLLARWCGPRAAVLAVVFEDEDRRSLRAFLRGTAQRAPAEARLAGLIPTPSLPERALRELARQPTPAAVAALLTAWKHPYGPALRPLTTVTHPDLLRMEVAINRRFAARALTGARRSGGGEVLVNYVRDAIDLENAYTALVLAGDDRELPRADLFLPGGGRLTSAAFERAAAAPDAAAAAKRLAEVFAKPATSRLAEVFRRIAGDPGGIEDTALRAHIRFLMQEQRRAPLGPAPVLAYALRLRAQVLDLRRLIWGIALGAPVGALR